MVTTNI